MKKWGILIAVPCLLALVGTSTASAQEIKAWWTTSGFMGPVDVKALIPSAPSRMSTFSISMWIIDHPKGLIVFDTGNNVAISDGKCETYWPKGQSFQCIFRTIFAWPGFSQWRRGCRFCMPFVVLVSSWDRADASCNVAG